MPTPAVGGGRILRKQRKHTQKCVVLQKLFEENVTNPKRVDNEEILKGTEKFTTNGFHGDGFWGNYLRKLTT